MFTLDDARPSPPDTPARVARLVAVGQPGAAAGSAPAPSTGALVPISPLPVGAQRRFGLHISALTPTLDARTHTGVDYDAEATRSRWDTPTAVRHTMPCYASRTTVQSVSTGAVVLGDKQHPDVTADFNTTCVVDLGERKEGYGGRDVCVEVKAWADVRATASALGATHAFGSVEGALLEKVYGLKARPGDRPWDVRAGTGG